MKQRGACMEHLFSVFSEGDRQTKDYALNDRADMGLRAEIVGKEFKLWYESCM